MELIDSDEHLGIRVRISLTIYDPELSITKTINIDSICGEKKDCYVFCPRIKTHHDMLRLNDSAVVYITMYLYDSPRDKAICLIRSPPLQMSDVRRSMDFFHISDGGSIMLSKAGNVQTSACKNTSVRICLFLKNAARILINRIYVNIPKLSMHMYLLYMLYSCDEAADTGLVRGLGQATERNDNSHKPIVCYIIAIIMKHYRR